MRRPSTRTWMRTTVPSSSVPDFTGADIRRVSRQPPDALRVAHALEHGSGIRSFASHPASRTAHRRHLPAAAPRPSADLRCRPRVVNLRRRRPAAEPESQTTPAPDPSTSPSAISTCDGSACVHAAPDDTAMSSKAHQQRFAIDAGESSRSGCPAAARPCAPFTVIPSDRALQPVEQPIAQRREPRRLRRPSPARAISAARAKPDDARHVQRADRMPRSWPPPSICAATVTPRFLRRTYKRADTLRPVDLVGA